MIDILVIDDNQYDLDLFSTILEKTNYAVKTASSASEALKYIKECQPLLILLDIEMKGTDGFGLCRQLKLCQKTNDIPIIFVSAFFDIDKKVQAFRLGAIDYITKPYDAQELIARIDTHIRERILSAEDLEIQHETIRQFKNLKQQIQRFYE